MSSTTDYSKLLILAYPGQGWSMTDDHVFETLHWDVSNSIEKPSLADLSQKMESVKSEEALRLLREKRNVLLTESDKYVLPDFPHASNEQKEAWRLASPGSISGRSRSFPHNKQRTMG